VDRHTSSRCGVRFEVGVCHLASIRSAARSVKLGTAAPSTAVRGRYRSHRGDDTMEGKRASRRQSAHVHRRQWVEASNVRPTPCPIRRPRARRQPRRMDRRHMRRAIARPAALRRGPWPGRRRQERARVLERDRGRDGAAEGGDAFSSSSPRRARPGHATSRSSSRST